MQKTATHTAQVHKVYSVATHLDQNPACAETGYSYQNIEYCKVLNIDNYSFMSVQNKNVKRVHTKSNPRWLRPRPRLKSRPLLTVLKAKALSLSYRRRCPPVASCHRRRPIVCCCGTTALEQFAR